MGNIYDGGPAFPMPYLSKNTENGDLTYHENIGGMSLRDKFAGDALIGFLSSDPTWNINYKHDEDSQIVADMLAGDCYKMAEAMLKARHAESDTPMPSDSLTALKAAKHYADRATEILRSIDNVSADDLASEATDLEKQIEEMEAVWHG